MNKTKYVRISEDLHRQISYLKVKIDRSIVSLVNEAVVDLIKKYVKDEYETSKS